MKMLAAVLSDSAPLAFMNLFMPQAKNLTHRLHDPEVVENREQGRDEDDGGQHLEREDDPVARALVAQAPVIMRGHTALSPSAPNTNDDPANEKSSSFLIPVPSTPKVCCPTVVFRTNSAKTIWSARPHAIVGRWIARRLDDQA